MENNKNANLDSILRLVLTFVGAFLTGGGVHLFFGHVIDTAYWQEITGVIMTIVSIWWGVKEKSIDEEKLSSGARQVVTFVMGIVTAKNLLTAQQGMAVVTFIGGLLPFFLSWWNKRQNQKVSEGKIKFSQLNGVDQSNINKNPYIPEDKKTAGL